MRIPSLTCLLLLSVFLCTGAANAQVTINELAAHPSEKIVKWSAAGVPSIGSGTAWNEAAFNHNGWALGYAPFGHGVAGVNTDLTTVMSGKAYALYLRKEFTASAAQAASAALLRLQIDYNDGFVAYLNGVEITRKNLGAAKHFVYASQRAYNPATTSGVSDLPTVPASQVLINGTNVLAIQVHNYDLATSLKLDASLGITGGATLISSGAAGGQWRYFVGFHEPSGIVVDTKLVTQPFTAPAGKEEDYEDPQEARDWIELRNAGATAASLTGWTLTDNVSQPGRWAFPAGTTIPAGGCLVVMCDLRQEANGASTADRLHASFKLEDDGGTVALFNGSTQMDAITYPGGQNAGTTFGRSAVNGTSLVFFESGTPGSANTGSERSARVADPVMSLPGGFYETDQTVALSCATLDATIRYTLDGSDPGETSALYAAPLTAAFINDKTGVVIRARAFAPGLVPSAIATQTYLIAQNAAIRTLPAMLMTGTDGRVFNKPNGVMSIQGGSYDGDGIWVPGNTETYNIAGLEGDAAEREISLEYRYPDSTPGLSLGAGMRLSASSYSRPRLTLQQTAASPWSWTQWREKPSFNLYFRGAYGPGKLTHPVFPGYDIGRFDKLRLRAGKNDLANPHIVDELCRRAHMAMGHEGVMGRWCTLYVNGQFKGYYNLVERILEDMLREHFGGTSAWDVIEPTSLGPVAEDGDVTAFNSFLNTTLAADLTNAANWAAVTQKMDIDNACDWFLMKFYAAMWDWPGNNWTMVRERSTGLNSRWRFIDWDNEGGFNAIGYTNQNVNYDMIGGLFSDNSTEVRRIFNRLRTSAEFRLRFADRVQKHMFNGGVLDDRGNAAWIKTQKDLLKAQVQPIISYVTGQAFNETWFNTWVAPATGRRTYLLGPNGTHLATYGLWPATTAPALSLQGGTVAPGTALTLTSSSGGTVYYTTDGSDPRLEGGSLAASALVYSSALTLNSSVTIRTRVRSAGGEWSPLSEASFLVNQEAPSSTNLVIAEFMYNPPSATVAETQAPNPITNGDDFEFVRLLNIGSKYVLLSQLAIANGITYAFSSSGKTTLAPGQSVLVVKSLVAFQKRYGTGYNSLIAAGSFSGGLSNGGETLELRNNGVLLNTVTYSDSTPWPKAADGYGPSLLLRDPVSAPDHNVAANWMASAGAGGQPGGVPHATTWAGWRDLSFHRTDDAASVKDADDDPDGDGLPNALEYALGTAPKIPDGPAVLPQGQIVNVGGQDYLALSCRVNAAATEAGIAVETSTSLAAGDWQQGAGQTETHVGPAGMPGGFQSFVIRASAPLAGGDKRRFMRMKVTVP